MMPASIMCPECRRLELECQAFIDEIYAVVNGSFGPVSEKLNRLFEKQDMRDEATEALYAHKKTHSR